jgi:hypothetical protein
MAANQQNTTFVINVTGTQQLNQATQAVKGFSTTVQSSNTALNKAGSGSKDFGQGLLQLSYVVDDVQYGLKGILNNIPMLVTSFGGTAGLAGGIAIAAVAMSSFVGTSKEVEDAIKSNEKAVKDYNERIRESKDLLDKLRESTKAPGVKQIGKDFAEAFSELGGVDTFLDPIMKNLREGWMKGFNEDQIQQRATALIEAAMKGDQKAIREIMRIDNDMINKLNENFGKNVEKSDAEKAKKQNEAIEKEVNRIKEEELIITKAVQDVEKARRDAMIKEINETYRAAQAQRKFLEESAKQVSDQPFAEGFGRFAGQAITMGQALRNRQLQGAIRGVPEKAIDQQLMGQVTVDLLRKGLAFGGVNAMEIAGKMIGQGRTDVNKAITERNTKAIEASNKQMAELAQAVKNAKMFLRRRGR